MRLALLMAATVAGAALFAALHPPPRDAYTAAGTVVIPVRSGASAEVELRTRQAAELLRQPNVVSRALERVLLASEPGQALGDLTVTAKPQAGIVGFSVRGATPDAANRFAEELGRETVEVLKLGRPTGDRFGLRVMGDFESDQEGWAATGPRNELAEDGVVSPGRYGGGALRAVCDNSDGCGVARVVEGRFPAGRRLTLTAWVRGREPSNVLVAIGSEVRQDRAIERATVGSEWRRLIVAWTPARDERRIFLAVNNAGPGSSDVDIDGVLLLTRSGPLAIDRERRLFEGRGFAYTTPTQIVASRTGSTLRWAAIGAGGGLVVGLAGIVAWTVATRRRHLVNA